VSTSDRDGGLRVHALLHRATLPEIAGSSQPDRPDCPWHTARPVSGCDWPGQWHNQRAIIELPQEGSCADLRAARLDTSFGLLIDAPENREQ